jgi:hypothetical protein
MIGMLSFLGLGYGACNDHLKSYLSTMILEGLVTILDDLASTFADDHYYNDDCVFSCPSDCHDSDALNACFLMEDSYDVLTNEFDNHDLLSNENTCLHVFF